MTLFDCQVGEAEVLGVSGERAIRKRLIDMGITTGTVLFIRKVAPMGDPIEIRCRGYELSLRKEEAKTVKSGGLTDEL
ncbi:MAG: FeoA family protein [Holdemania massiliensis]